ncbi:DinB family protein [Kitasatospora sp. NPDC096147]|uniref:DinB family protein n=1 Tax=Kitasatospora sp. NPDC096147 TaxID=3364093 RepID=UPI0037F60301
MSFVIPTERVDPPGAGSERAALTGWLDWHRATLLRKLAGLGDEQLRKVVLPSGLSLLGIVKHLTEVEQGWFAIEYAGSDEPYLYGGGETFELTEADSTESVVTHYLAACERSRQITAATPDLGRAVPNEELGTVDLRWVLVHMVEETARHNGHADAIRELLDGSTGL